MLSKCASPDCAVEFDYRQGEFFRFHSGGQNAATGLPSNSDLHYWLCGRCSQHYLILYRKDHGVLVARHLPQLSETHVSA